MLRSAPLGEPSGKAVGSEQDPSQLSFLSVKGKRPKGISALQNNNDHKEKLLQM